MLLMPYKISYTTGLFFIYSSSSNSSTSLIINHGVSLLLLMRTAESSSHNYLDAGNEPILPIQSVV
jgi:hypothetical protein